MTEVLSQPRSNPWSTLGRAVVMVLLVGCCFLLLRGKLADITLADLRAAMAAIPSENILLAVVLGGISHLALSGYDLLALRRIARRVPWPRALAGGFAGTVMSQVLGFGLITGSFARVRIYRANGINPPQAVALSGLVAAGFFLGLCVLLGILMLIDPGPAVSVTGMTAATVRGISISALALLFGTVWVASGRSVSVPRAGLTVHVPDLKWLLGAACLAAADLAPAALCLAVLLPADAMPGLAAFVAIYVTALALGHLIGSPGATGPFEGVLFLALPQMGAGELAAGILMYRLTYYLPAFVLALGFIARAKRPPAVPVLNRTVLRDRVAWAMDQSPNAEAELTWLGDKHVFFPAEGDAFVSYGIAGRVWLVIGDPIGPPESWDSLMDGLDAEARAAGAVVAIYKATEQARPFWEARGWILQPLGEEAHLDLDEWSLEGRNARELRRKCRTADKAGLVIEQCAPGALPMTEAGAVADAWDRAKPRGEQTFSMGHWAPEFATRHHATTARLDGELIAFATFWVSGDGHEWMLDLMRQQPDVPNGTMHRLLAEGASMAKAAGATHFNLCMAPLSGLKSHEPVTWMSHLGAYCATRFDHIFGLLGMRRFKQMFRPDWSPRHMAVRSRLTLAEAFLAAHQLVQGHGAPSEWETTRSPMLHARVLSEANPEASREQAVQEDAAMPVPLDETFANSGLPHAARG